MKTIGSFAILAMAMLVLGACAQTPHFADAIGAPEASETRQLVVLPVSGARENVGRALGANMAWGLREAGYSTYFADRVNTGQPYVQGEIVEVEYGSEVVWIGLQWSVHGDGDQLQGVYRHQIAAAMEDWLAVAPATLTMITAEAVPGVHEHAAPIMFPAGVPVMEFRSAQDAMQVASLSGFSDTDPLDDALADGLPESTWEPVLLAQFEPVFDPAVMSDGVLQEPSGAGSQAVPQPSPVVVTPSPEPVVATPEPAAVPEPAAPSIVAEEPETSPFAEIADEAPTEPASTETLNSGTAALVTTDPAVTVAPSEPEKIPEPEPATTAAPTPEILATPEPESQPEPESEPVVAAPEPVVPPVPVLFVQPVRGAPGDGNQELTESIAGALRSADIAITDDEAKATHLLAGLVDIGEPLIGRQKARITWRIKRLDGTLTGEAVQENMIPAGSLDREWGATADAVAVGAAQGIADLLTE